MHPSRSARTDGGDASVGSVFRYVLQTLLRGRWVMAASLSLVLGVVVLHLATTEPVYEATSSLIIEAPEGDGGSSMLDVAALGGSRDILIEVEVLRSLDVAKRVARRLTAQHDGAAPSPYEAAAFPVFAPDEDGRVPTLLDLARTLQDRVDVEQTRRDVGVVLISAESTSPEEAAAIANLYAEEYAGRNLDESRAQARRLRTFIEEQLEARRTDLAGAERALQRYQEREEAVAIDQEAQQLARQMADLQALRDQAQVELEMVEAQLASLEGEVAQIEPGLAERVSSAGMEQGIARLNEQIAHLELRIEQTYAKNPELRQDPDADADLARLRQEVSGLQAQVRERAARYVEGVMATGGIDPSAGGDGAEVPAALAYVTRLRRQITDKNIEASALRARLDVLGQRLASYEREFERIPAQARQLATLQRQQRGTESTYEWLLQQYEETRIAEASEFGSARILDVAEVPKHPIAPRALYSLVLGLLLGGIVGLVIVFGREMMDDRLRRPEDVRALDVPLVGVLPRLRAPWWMPWKRLPRVTVEQVAAERPRSPAAEAYQRVAAGLDRVAGTDRGYVVLVTSPKGADGRTTTAANLAASLAQTGCRTVLVDGHVAHPRAHALFGEPVAPGLSNLLQGEVPLREIVHTTGTDNLWVLPAGDAVPSPAAMTGAKEMGALLAYLRRTFDRVVIDAGALLGASGATALTARADAVLLVLRAGATRIADAQEALDELDPARGLFTLAVLNDFDGQAAYGAYTDRGYYGRFGSRRVLRERPVEEGRRLLEGPLAAAGRFDALPEAAAPSPALDAPPPAKALPSWGPIVSGEPQREPHRHRSPSRPVPAPPRTEVPPFPATPGTIMLTSGDSASSTPEDASWMPVPPATRTQGDGSVQKKAFHYLGTVRPEDILLDPSVEPSGDGQASRRRS